MRKVLVRALGAVAGAASLAGVANGEEANTISEAISEGELIAEARLRYETFEQVGQNDADALTLRSRLGWQTGTWNGLSALIEFEELLKLPGALKVPALLVLVLFLFVLGSFVGDPTFALLL